MDADRLNVHLTCQRAMHLTTSAEKGLSKKSSHSQEKQALDNQNSCEPLLTFFVQEFKKSNDRILE